VWIDDAEVVVDVDAMDELVELKGALVEHLHPIDGVTPEVGQTEELLSTLRGVLREPVEIKRCEILQIFNNNNNNVSHLYCAQKCKTNS